MDLLFQELSTDFYYYDCTSYNVQLFRCEISVFEDAQRATLFASYRRLPQTRNHFEPL